MDIDTEDYMEKYFKAVFASDNPISLNEADGYLVHYRRVEIFILTNEQYIVKNNGRRI